MNHKRWPGKWAPKKHDLTDEVTSKQSSNCRTFDPDLRVTVEVGPPRTCSCRWLRIGSISSLGGPRPNTIRRVSGCIPDGWNVFRFWCTHPIRWWGKGRSLCPRCQAIPGSFRKRAARFGKRWRRPFTARRCPCPHGAQQFLLAGGAGAGVRGTGDFTADPRSGVAFDFEGHTYSADPPAQIRRDHPCQPTEAAD